jgi:ABC-2 type transport system permease protein
MSTAALSFPAPTSAVRNLRIFLTEARYEFVRALRTRAFSLSVIGFPVMFYILFGLVLNRGQNLDGTHISIAKYILGSYAVFGSLGAAIFGIGVGVAADLAAGWLELKRASPMPPLAYLLSKMVSAAAFGVIIVSMLTLLGIGFGHVHLTLAEYFKITTLAAAGAIPFSGLGLVVALLVPPASAGGIANMIYLPMSFCSGLWVPLQFLPGAIQHIAQVLPTYHLAQLMYASLGGPSNGSTSNHWLALLGFTLLMLGIAAIAFQRREQNS